METGLKEPQPPVVTHSAEAALALEMGGYLWDLSGQDNSGDADNYKISA